MFCFKHFENNYDVNSNYFLKKVLVLQKQNILYQRGISLKLKDPFYIKAYVLLGNIEDIIVQE